jgi:hypothetical protein
LPNILDDLLDLRMGIRRRRRVTKRNGEIIRPDEQDVCCQSVLCSVGQNIRATYQFHQPLRFL